MRSDKRRRRRRGSVRKEPIIQDVDDISINAAAIVGLEEVANEFDNHDALNLDNIHNVAEEDP